MGGSTGEVIESTKSRARQYKREKIDEQTRAAQHNVGQVTGDAMSSFEQGMEGVGDFVERNTRSLPGRGGGDGAQGSDTAEANYSSSGQTQTSSGRGKKADLSDTDKKKPKGASKQLTVKKK